MDEVNSGILEYDEDITDAEAPEPLPIGPYDAVIRSAERMESKQNPGKYYVAVGFHIDTDSYPADYDPTNAPDGTTLIYRRVPYGQDRRSKYVMSKFCKTIGAPAPGARVDLGDWIGLTAHVDVDHEEYEETPRAQIVKVNPA